VASSIGQASGMRVLGVALTAAALVPTAALTAAAQAGPVPARSVTTICASLSLGAVGPAVATIQKAVLVAADGDYGPMTRRAVERFQRAHRLAVTGVVDGATWHALPLGTATAACGQPAAGTGVGATCATLTEGDVGPAVAVLQRAIGTTPDGGFGPLTRAALVATQRRLHQPVTGTVGPLTWFGLRLAHTPACAVTGTLVKPTSAQVQSPGAHAAPKDGPAQAAVRSEVIRLTSGLAKASGTSTDPIAAAAMRFALAQRGHPYQWGGTGPKGYDCSGLVYASYRSVGLAVPRVAGAQYGAGVAVPLNRLQAGDLVFYASDLVQPTTIYHVALYVGHDTIVNAPYTGQVVREEPLWLDGLLPTAFRPAPLLKLPIRQGEQGTTVEQLQVGLRAHGFRLSVDGSDGPQTVAAVRAFQQRAHLGVTGVADAATWIALI